MYMVCGDAVAPLWRVMRRLRGCRDRIYLGIQPTCKWHRSSRCRGFSCAVEGFWEECLRGGCRFCSVLIFTEMNYCRRCVAVTEGRWLVRRRSEGALFCSSTVGVLGEGPRLR